MNVEKNSGIFLVKDKNALAKLRHDLRTPINHILGYSELIADELADKGVVIVEDDLEKIRSAARQLLNMVSDHLSEEKIERLSSQSLSSNLSSSISPPKIAVSLQDFNTSPLITGRILIVDDNAENRETLARRLQRQGHIVTTAIHGTEALEILCRDPFDLVLLDVMMPVLDGYETLSKLKADVSLCHIPVIMISAIDEMESVVHCIEKGAEDYLSKPFNPTLLRARIGASLEKKKLRDQEQTYLQQIEKTQAYLKSELEEAAKYVRSIFPQPMEAPFSIDWNYAPSMELGGDAFGYHWIDEHHLAIYLLDVCGHGVGASLLSVSAINVIRSGSLPRTDFRKPDQVLAGLNNAFPMEQQNNMYFTIWYGVYHWPSQTLRHSSGGHPPALLFTPNGTAVTELRAPGTLIGVMPNVLFASEECKIVPNSCLVVLCDGTYEIKRPNHTMIEFEDFKNFMLEYVYQPDGLDRLLDWVHALRGGSALEDDFSILRVKF